VALRFGARLVPSEESKYLTLLPAIVVGFAVVAAGYSSVRKFVVDKNLRLSRQGPGARSDDHH
jgi:hypothetical protein